MKNGFKDANYSVKEKGVVYDMLYYNEDDKTVEVQEFKELMKDYFGKILYQYFYKKIQKILTSSIQIIIILNNIYVIKSGRENRLYDSTATYLSQVLIPTKLQKRTLDDDFKRLLTFVRKYKGIF